MAAGINFNPASFRGATARTQVKTQESFASGPVDGYQPSANAPATPPGVTFNVTAEQLASAAFQQTLATLTASGIPVGIVIAASSAQPGSGASGVSRQEFQQLSDEVGSISRQVRQLGGEVASLKPQPPKPPTYGGD